MFYWDISLSVHNVLAITLYRFMGFPPNLTNCRSIMERCYMPSSHILSWKVKVKLQCPHSPMGSFTVRLCYTQYCVLIHCFLGKRFCFLYNFSTIFYIALKIAFGSLYHDDVFIKPVQLVSVVATATLLQLVSSHDGRMLHMLWIHVGSCISTSLYSFIVSATISKLYAGVYLYCQHFLP